MSVIESNRTENILQVSIKARALAVYTLRITRNQKIFASEFKEDLTDLLITDAVNIFRWIWKANCIRVKTSRDWERRSRLQVMAKEQCNDMLALISLAKPTFHLKTKRVEYWVSQVTEVRKMIEKWHEKDAERYKSV